jgi:NADPH-dependent glutamate synthase beta subunit-like oxidoreductase/Pyruvate/2-oxoacid:ferredoxin oxidoreductase delta subunit
MSTSTTRNARAAAGGAGTSTPARSFRRFRDGEHEWHALRERIFQAGHSHKCPTYIQATPPCQASCPAGEDIRSYLNIARGIEKAPAGMPWQEYAWRRLTEANPFPSVMGRVCPAPCETGCNRNALEDHVGINSVEHFLGEWANAHGLAYPKPAHRSGKHVAVIGGGPAGLSCAYQLARKGHDVTIFDEHAELGGMMRYGIPGFRTPREVLDDEIARILDLGVGTRLGCRVGRDVTLESLQRDYDAVFLGLGAQSGRALPAPGGDAPNVVTATAFLRAFNDGRLRHVGERVLVVGGGDTSIDVATVARRLGRIADPKATDFPEQAIAGRLAHDAAVASARQGCEVTLTSVFAVDEMQANRHEVEQAMAEGIVVRGGLAPVRVEKDARGRAIGLTVAQCTARIAGGRLEIKVVEGTEETIAADLVVSAVGQAVDFTGLEAFDNGKGAVAADRNYRVPGHGNVFAGGDVIRPHLLTTAIGHGAIAADGIDRLLAGTPAEKRPTIDVHAFDLHRKMVEKGLSFEAPAGPMRGTDRASVGIHNYDDRSDRYVIPHDKLFLGHFGHSERHARAVLTLTRESALGNFAERLAPLGEAQVVAEAKRCMSCGQCFECDNCVVYCPQKAVLRVPKKEATTGRYVYTDYDRCIGCHICADVCPTGYIQMGLGE